MNKTICDKCKNEVGESFFEVNIKKISKNMEFRVRFPLVYFKEIHICEDCLNRYRIENLFNLFKED